MWKDGTRKKGKIKLALSALPGFRDWCKDFNCLFFERNRFNYSQSCLNNKVYKLFINGSPGSNCVKLVQVY